MTLEDLPEMVSAWHAGSLSFEDIYFLCLYLLEDHEPEVVLSPLPTALREKLDSRLRADWDNDTPPEECIIFNSGTGEHPATGLIVERARRWIAKRPPGSS